MRNESRLRLNSLIWELSQLCWNVFYFRAKSGDVFIRIFVFCHGCFGSDICLQGFPGGAAVKIHLLTKTTLQSWVRKIPWRRKWQPTPVFLPGESHGQRSLVGYSPRGRKESDNFTFTKYLLLSFNHCLSSIYYKSDSLFSI